MLDDLIAYLHAAMPRMRDTSSTVAQEIALVRAYLEIVKLQVGERLVVTVDVPPGAGGIRMPPMMMLPLAEHAVSLGIGHRRGDASLRIAIEVTGARRLVVRIVDGGAGFMPEHAGAGVEEIRSRPRRALCGDAALELHGDASGCSEAVLDIPIEAVAVTPDDELATASKDRSAS
jgi:sensor histidine kinase YesM